MTIAAIGGAARAAAIDVWTLYAAAIVSGFGIAIMQPGMATLVREWLPSRLALGTIGYSSGMLMGAMFPAVFTIAFILPAVGGSWRLDVVLWAIPALLIAPVFLLVSPKIPEDVDKQAAGGSQLVAGLEKSCGLAARLSLCEQQQPLFRHQRLSR